MLGSLLRAVLVVVLVVVLAGFLLGWWNVSHPPDGSNAVGTSGVSTERAREVGAEVGERAATAVNRAGRAVDAGTITAKIKAKMALDDTVKALDVDVDTRGSVVTVSGRVASEAQRDRVLQLARETEGVTQVVDKLAIR